MGKIFIVDNSASMQAHRKEVFDVTSLLIYMLKLKDPDGLDLYFTQSTQKVHSGKSSKLSAAVYEAKFKGMSDMRNRLSRILQEHKSKFSTTSNPTAQWYRKAGHPKAQKPLSFYILTDGLWQPNDVGSVIENLVDEMRGKGLPKDHVGIQFIQFGEDEQGTARLSHLDHGLGLKSIDM